MISTLQAQTQRQVKTFPARARVLTFVLCTRPDPVCTRVHVAKQPMELFQVGKRLPYGSCAPAAVDLVQLLVGLILCASIPTIQKTPDLRTHQPLTFPPLCY